jgi:two-component system, NarL family, response regulator DevR
MSEIRLVVVDDHAVVRQGVRALLDSQDDISVVGEAATQADALSETERERPDVVVMDVRLAEGNGIEATKQIRARFPDSNVLILTSFQDDEAIAASARAGASAYVLKELRGLEIIAKVRAIASGEDLLDSAVTKAPMMRLRTGKHLMGDKLARLSPQEERILELVAEGRTNREIARTMELAEKTVKNYVSRMLLKLDLHRRSEAAAYLGRRTSSQG